MANLGEGRSVSGVVAATLIGACVVASGSAFADKAFSGEDAAYIDWAWKNCAVTSTNRQHDLVEQARNKSNDAFQRAYEAQYRKIIDTTPGPPEVRRTCESVKEWYGSSGSRIAALIQNNSEKGTVAGTVVGTKASSQPGGGKRGGGGGGR